MATNSPVPPANVQVVCRFRPQNKKEEEKGGRPCVVFSEDGKTVTLKSEETEQPHRFNFDKIFAMDSSQEEVYEIVGKPVVEDIMKGYNGTIFAYGQTSAGKTHTMMGPTDLKHNGYSDDPKNKGIIPRVVDAIFDAVDESDENIEFSIKVSYIEIYMEKIRDLLDVSKVNLQIQEDRSGGKGIHIPEATEVYVASEEEVFEVMRQGSLNRAVASTQMNVQSSRSHSIFIIVISQKHLVTLEQKVSKLFLVDLAGSEKVSKTQAEGLQLDEARNINKSLTMLGMVINALTDGKSTHIPYRDSKLTRLLQDSLGGNSRTSLVVNCSPSSYNEYETISTLRFGTRAKSIKNKPKINRELTVQELKLLLNKAEKQIQTLNLQIEEMKKEIVELRGGKPPRKISTVDAEEEVEGEEEYESRAVLKSKIDDLEEQLTQKMEENEGLKEERDELRYEMKKISDEVGGHKDQVEFFQSRVNELETLLEEKEKSLNSVSREFDELNFGLEKLKFEHSEAQANVDELRDSNEKLMKENSDLQSLLHNLKAGVTSEEVDNPLLKEWENERRERLKEEEMFQEKLRQNVMSLENLSGPNKFSEEVQKTLATIQEENQELRKMIDSLESSVESLKVKNQELSQRNDELAIEAVEKRRPQTARTYTSSQITPRKAFTPRQIRSYSSNQLTVPLDLISSVKAKKDEAALPKPDRKPEEQEDSEGSEDWSEDEEEDEEDEEETTPKEQTTPSNPLVPALALDAAGLGASAEKKKKEENEDVNKSKGDGELKKNSVEHEAEEDRKQNSEKEGEEEDITEIRIDLDADRETLLKQITNLQEEFNNLNNEVVQKDEQIEEMHEEFQWEFDKLEANYKNQLNCLQRKMDTELETMDKKVKVKDDMIKDRDKTIRDLQRELESLRHTDNADLERKINELREEKEKQEEDFSRIRSALLKDLQNRCEKVVELEMSLDEAREQYKSTLAGSTTKQLRKKVSMLNEQMGELEAECERLKNENQTVKLEIQLSEKKLAIRNDRISNLEKTLRETQERVRSMEESFLNEKQKLLKDLQLYKDRLSSGAMDNKHPHHSSHKILKPIRGGRKRAGSFRSGQGELDSPSEHSGSDNISVVSSSSSNRMEYSSPKHNAPNAVRHEKNESGWLDRLMKSFKKGDKNRPSPSKSNEYEDSEPLPASEGRKHN